jgi:hypothetical protein
MSGFKFWFKEKSTRLNFEINLARFCKNLGIEALFTR